MLNAIRYLFLATCSAMTIASAHAQDELEPVALMFFNGMERHELSLISNSASRCGSLYTVVSQILARDTNDTEVSESLSELGNNLLLMSMMTNGALLTHRGKEPESNDLQQRSIRQLEVFTEIYVKRMTKNQAASGEMWSQDLVIKSDMDFCKQLTILFSDEWTVTLETNNWSYWDEAFAE
jgi:hypothetical protein